MDPWIHGSMDPGIHGSMDPWIHEFMDPWVHGSMDSWIHGSELLIPLKAQGGPKQEHQKFYGAGCRQDQLVAALYMC